MENAPISFDEFGADETIEVKQQEVECSLLTGSAGTGKTYTLKQRIAEDPEYGELCATTGIAGVNLGAVTLNSVLGYFDTDSLEELYINGRLRMKMAQFFSDHHRLIIDEVSMMDGRQLNFIVRTMDEISGYKSVLQPIGIVLTGDFCQLPPVKGKWAFDSDVWHRFEPNITRLTKNWRQSDPNFLAGINAIREGKGPEGVALLQQTAVEFANGLNSTFDGTTIVAKNDQVERFNTVALEKLPGDKIRCQSKRWGKQRGEWKLIPDVLEMKKGAYVMILANDSPNFTYANGDCGHIVDYDTTRGMFFIELVRNGNTVCVPRIVRTNEVKESTGPAGGHTSWPGNQWFQGMEEFKVEKRRRYGIGQVEYAPIRLAYAATVHKTQGLSLDRVQMDVRDGFFGSPAMAYVAISRAKTPEGLRIVGGADVFAKRVKIAQEVLRWL